MGSLLVVTGPPGAGKSTVAALVVDRFDPSVLITGDAFFGFLARGAIPPWLPESREQNEVVMHAAAMAAAQYARGGYTTVYDGVVGPWFLSTFLSAGGLDRLDYVMLLPSVDICLERVRTRAGHGFTDPDGTRKMHHEFASAEIDARHVLRDPSGSPEAIADLIASTLEAGTFTYGGV